MTSRFYLNNDWKFTSEYNEAINSLDYDETSLETVRIPHTVKETPFNYFDESLYQLKSGYRKVFTAPAEWKGRRIRLTFEGVAHRTLVYINNEQVASHQSGYTAFTIDITDKLVYGDKNVISLMVDSRETLNQPPFGFVIDYMTYGGIYRDVYIEVSGQVYISDIFHTAAFENGTELNTEVTVNNPDKVTVYVKQFLNDKELTVKTVAGSDSLLATASLENIERWDIDNPTLYSIRTQIIGEGDKVLDEKTVRFGFRESEFRTDGYYLNGRKLKIRGLNRHQSYPYVGYAMPASMQIQDADILKNELGVNAVRTSHYPQSQAFIDRCDEIGLLVFTELPGWQYIGDDAWKDIAVINVTEMVKQYRNHPSIIMWGVRINESIDDDEFYLRTNEVAHRLDPTRPTGGVRAGKRSHLLEDVYTYNDFVHDGKAKGCEPKKKVTSDMSKPYLISEYNGHMYSTKSFDGEEHRREHALRHANVLNAVAGEQDIAGSFGWCMFDYNTHKDFGSGDRICYHGVMDMFRNPKLAAAVYACEQEETPVLELSSSMDIGEHPGCNRGFTWLLSNADSVRMYKNDRFIKEYFPKDSPYRNLKHGPILLDDFIGNAIEENEKGSDSFKRDIKYALNATAMYGLSNLPKSVYLKAVKMIVFDHMCNFPEVVRLYNTYIGDWGGKATVYSFEAIKDGKVVKKMVKKPTNGVHFDISLSTDELVEKETYDVAELRIRAVDDEGNQVSFFNEPVSVTVEGEGTLIGPDCFGLKGGMAGAYIKTIGSAGKIKVTVKNSQCGTQTFELKVRKEAVTEI